MSEKRPDITLFLFGPLVLLACTDGGDTFSVSTRNATLDCSALPPFALNSAYEAGAQVKNVGRAFTCVVPGWCNQGGPYEPGEGWAADDAWDELGTCEFDGSGGSTSAGGSSGTGGIGGSGAASSGGSGGNTYGCPTTCTAPSCFCAELRAPGGLPSTEVPQFIVLTFDDALHGPSYDYVQTVLGAGHENPNGCPIPATFYVSTEYTDFHKVQQRHAQGSEIAVHTMTHTTSVSTSAETWRREVVGARNALTQLGLVPHDEIVGFRAPFLEHNDASFRVLWEEGFLYDSSITEQLGGASKTLSSYIYPYTFDYLGAQTCFVGECPRSPYPGLFEVPLWSMYTPAGQITTSMDYPGGYVELLNTFQHVLDARYVGNRAPLGIFLHPGWLSDPAHVSALNDFAHDALAKGDVWFVTNRQLVEWMKAPRSVNQMHDFTPVNCSPRPIGAEICNGWDDDQDGQVDEGLTRICSYPRGNFETCATECPAQYPWPDQEMGTGGTDGTGGTSSAGGSAGTGGQNGTDEGSLSIVLTSNWGTGYCAEARVSNDTPSAALGWTASFELDGGTVGSGWNGVLSSNGSHVTIDSESWNSFLAPGAMQAAGFCGTISGNLTFTQEHVVLQR